MAIRFDEIELAGTGHDLYPIIHNGGGNGLRITTATGYGDFGSGNTSYFHISTDRGTFYVSKNVSFDGNLSAYGGSETISNFASVSASTFTDKDNTNYFVNPNGSSSLYTPVTMSTNDTTLTFQDAGTNAFQIKTSAGDELYLGSNNNYQLQMTTSGNVNTQGDWRFGASYVKVGNSSTYNSDAGNWGSRFQVASTVHARIDVAQDANAMMSTWYCHTGHTGSLFGTVTAHDQWLYSHNAKRQTLFSGYSQEEASYRAPIFYDSGDTGYYSDMNGQSVLYNLKLIGAKHTYLEINPGSSHESMVRYMGSAGSSWYVGKRTAAGTGITTSDFHWYSEAAAATVGGITTSGVLQVTGSHRAPLFYDSNNTSYYVDPNAQSSMYGVAIRGDLSSTATGNQIFFWGGGNSTTSAIGFKANGGNFANPTGNGDGYNTYLTMDTDGRGWVFRRGTGSSNFTSAYTAGWILNNGIFQANASMRAPIFYDSNDTSYFIDLQAASHIRKIRGVRTNLATSEGWAETNAWSVGTQTGFFGGSFTINGSSDENNICYVEGPSPNGGSASQRRTLAWKCRYNGSGNGADGGWNKTITGVDYNKAHISVIYVKRVADGNGNFYHGTSTCLNVGDGSTNTNPYFIAMGSQSLPLGVWCVSIGYLHANNDGEITSSQSFSGIYNLTTGERIIGATDYRMTASSTSQHRTFLYYSSNTSTEVWMANPGFYEVNGSEPNINELLMRPEDRVNELRADSNMRAPLFYDSNDTSYYVDPNSESKIKKLWINNGGASGIGWSTGFNQGSGSNYWNQIQDAGVARQRNFGTGGYDWYSSGGTQLMDLSNTGTLFAAADVRSPIFYDSNDTTYYIDPSATTSIKTVGSWRANSHTWDGEYAGKMQYHSSYWYIQTANGVYIRNASGANNITLAANGVGTAANDWRAPIFYDSGDTSYYTDPASTSVLNAASFAGRVSFSANSTNNWDTIATSTGSLGALEVYNNGVGNDAFMTFHVGSDFACYFGLDGGTNKLSVGGWSMGAASYEIYHSGNLPSLATLGAQASGSYAPAGGSYGTDWYANALYHDEWVRNHSNNAGHYWSSTSWHLYPKNSEFFFIRSGLTSSTGLAMTCASETPVGYFYGDSGNKIGILNNSGAWILKCDSSKNVTAEGSSRSPIFYDSQNTAYYTDPASTSVVNAIKFGASTNNGTIAGGNTWGMKLTTDSGYIQFGPANSSHAHIYTDRPNIYANAPITVNGSSIINQYDIRSKVFYDVDDTSYYMDAASSARALSLKGHITMNEFAATVYGIGVTALSTNLPKTDIVSATVGADTTCDIGVDEKGNVVRTTQEATWNLNRTNYNSLTTSAGGSTLLSAPGTNKFIIVEKVTWLVKYTYNGSNSYAAPTGQFFEIRQSGGSSDTLAVLSYKHLNSILFGNGSGGGARYGIYEHDTGFSTLNRVYKPNQAVTINRKTTATLPTNIAFIILKIRYRVFDAGTF